MQFFSISNGNFTRCVLLNSVIPNAVAFIVVTEMTLSDISYIFPFSGETFASGRKKISLATHDVIIFHIRSY